MNSPLMRTPYEGNEESLNEDLYELLKAADLDINYQVFTTMIDLLRQGVTAEALYFLLTQVVHHSGFYQKMRKFTSKREATTKRPDRPQKAQDSIERTSIASKQDVEHGEYL